MGKEVLRQSLVDIANRFKSLQDSERGIPGGAICMSDEGFELISCFCKIPSFSEPDRVPHLGLWKLIGSPCQAALGLRRKLPFEQKRNAQQEQTIRGAAVEVDRLSSCALRIDRKSTRLNSSH